MRADEESSSEPDLANTKQHRLPTRAAGKQDHATFRDQADGLQGGGESQEEISTGSRCMRPISHRRGAARQSACHSLHASKAQRGKLQESVPGAAKHRLCAQKGASVPRGALAVQKAVLERILARSAEKSRCCVILHIWRQHTEHLRNQCRDREQLKREIHTLSAHLHERRSHMGTSTSPREQSSKHAPVPASASPSPPTRACRSLDNGRAARHYRFGRDSQADREQRNRALGSDCGAESGALASNIHVRSPEDRSNRSRCTARGGEGGGGGGEPVRSILAHLAPDQRCAFSATASAAKNRSIDTKGGVGVCSARPGVGSARSSSAGSQRYPLTQRWEQMLSDDFVDTDGLIDALRSNATVMSPFAHDLVPGSSLGAKKQWGDAASQDWDAGPENASEDVSVVVKDPRPVMAHGTGEAAGCRGRESPSSLSLSQREREV